jgi:hypothetical protein
MKKVRLDVDTLEVTRIEMTPDVEIRPLEGLITGTSGYCNTCNTWCDWTV